MKRSSFFAFVVVGVLLFSFPTFAESPVLDTMSFEELLELRRQIDNKLTQLSSDIDSNDNTYKGMVYVSNGNEIQINSYKGSDSTLVIPDSIDGIPVTRIGGKAFETGKSIRNLILPQGLKHIGDNAFSSLNIEGVLVLPASLEYIGDWAFYSCAFSGIVIQGSPRIKYRALDQAGNRNLKFIYFREGSSPDFWNYPHFSYVNSLELIIIPASVKNLPDNFSLDCPNVTIVCPPDTYAESYAKEHWIVCNTADYDEYVAQYEALITP